MSDATWLERSDPQSEVTREAWRWRARTGIAERRAQQEADGLFAQTVAQCLALFREGRKHPSAENDRLAEVRRQARDDARDRPWLKVKPIYPIGGLANGPISDWLAAAGLVASLIIDPPLPDKPIGESSSTGDATT